MALSVEELRLRARAYVYAKQHERPQREHTLLEYAQHTWPGYQIRPHLEQVAAELEAIERGDNKRLMIFMPPRFGKSELVSIRFPAWYLCKHPDRMVMAASYGDMLAREFGESTRDLVGSERSRDLYPAVRLKPDAQAALYWKTQQGGRYLSSVIGGGITGHGAHLFIVDDPIKNREEAESDVYRERMWRWFRGVARTRLEPGGAIVLMHTRWHEDDLAGRILRELPGWRVISIPAIDGEGNTPWPERYSLEELRAIRFDVGEREWASQYQQRPAPDEGAIFKWWPTYKVTPRPDAIQELLMPIDTAYTDTSGSDYTAWSLWARAGGKLHLLDAQRVRMDTPDAEDEIRRYQRETTAYYRSQGYRGNVKVLTRKSVAIDRVMGQHLRAGSIQENGRRVGMQVTDVPLPPMGGKNVKEQLGRIVSDHFQGGQALIPEGYAAWLEPWLQEHKGFPAAQHDHWVETTIIVLWYAFRSAPIVRQEPRAIYEEA